MSGGDVVWLPWVALLAVLALAGAWWAARRGDAPGALRRLGYALGVLALWALGVPTLLSQLWSTLGGWLTRLVFSPLSWLGLIAAAVAVLLVLVGAAWGRRHDPRPTKAVASPRGAAPVAASSSEDAEIEALLRKRGIS